MAISAVATKRLKFHIHQFFAWNRWWWGGSGISWTTCKPFAPRSRQTTSHPRNRYEKKL